MSSVAMTYISNYTAFCLIVLVIQISINMVVTPQCFFKDSKSSNTKKLRIESTVHT